MEYLEIIISFSSHFPVFKFVRSNTVILSQFLNMEYISKTSDVSKFEIDKEFI